MALLDKKVVVCFREGVFKKLFSRNFLHQQSSLRNKLKLDIVEMFHLKYITGNPEFAIDILGFNLIKSFQSYLNIISRLDVVLIRIIVKKSFAICYPCQMLFEQLNSFNNVQAVQMGF